MTIQDWTAPLLSCPPVWDRGLLQALEREVLPEYLQGCRWFGGKGRPLQEVRVVQDLRFDDTEVHLLLVETTFAEGQTERYLMPLILRQGVEAATDKVIARFDGGGMLCDALHAREFQLALFRTLTGTGAGPPRIRVMRHEGEPLDPADLKMAVCHMRVHAGEQSNTSISYADTWLLKFFRKFATGVHPEVEMTHYLTKHHFNVPGFVSALHLETTNGAGVLAMLAEYCENQGDGWVHALDTLARYFDDVIGARSHDPSTPAEECIGGVYLGRVEQLGRLTAEMHLALSDSPEDPAFQPEPFTDSYRSSLYQSMRDNAARVFGELKQRLPLLPETIRPLAQSVLSKEKTVQEVFGPLLNSRVNASVIRVHGDFHLGQVLNTGEDFVVIDFEGEPRLSLSERRMKHCALRDVAGMLRSFDYAAAAALQRQAIQKQARLQVPARQWVRVVSQAYLKAYFATAADAAFVPQDRGTAQMLLDVHVLDKAIYEVGYELSYRPHMAGIPLAAVTAVLQG